MKKIQRSIKNNPLHVYGWGFVCVAFGIAILNISLVVQSQYFIVMAKEVSVDIDHLVHEEISMRSTGTDETSIKVASTNQSEVSFIVVPARFVSVSAANIGFGNEI